MWVPLVIMLSNVCERDGLRTCPPSEESLEPNGVIGDALGESSDDPRVDWLDPLPRLFSPVVEPCGRCAHVLEGTGGRVGLGTYALG